MEKADSATWGTLMVLPLALAPTIEREGYLLRWPLGQTGEFPFIHIIWGIDGGVIRCFQERFRDDRDAEFLGILDVRIGIYLSVPPYRQRGDRPFNPSGFLFAHWIDTMIAGGLWETILKYDIGAS
jgi:hypothetical protein